MSLLMSATLFGCDFADHSRAREAVKAELTDPDSAQFRNEEESAKGSVTCGEVNSRNRMGGYVGFTRYIYVRVGDKPTATISPGDPDFDEYDRYKENEYLQPDEAQKVRNACIFVVAWETLCSEAQKALLRETQNQCQTWLSQF